MYRKLVWLIVVAALVLPVSVAYAQGEPARPRGNRPPEEQAQSPAQQRPGGAAAEQGTQPRRPPVEDKLVQTKHTARIAGQEISYTATAGTYVLKADDGTPKANVFFVAYTKDDVSDLSKRPVSFSYNGGPGSASLWVHVGGFGPRRVVLNADGSGVPAPYSMVDNEDSVLDATDIVFIDAVSTGYSRPVAGENHNQFHGLNEDAEWFGDFIRLYITRNQRWESPKFLIGESYGTTRSAALSGYLQQRYDMYLSGIVLVSAVLNFQTLNFATGNELPPILFLPTYTATAWYHKRLPADLQQQSLDRVTQEARHFAETEYSQALFLGDRLPAAEHQKIVQQLARFTGLSPKYIEEANLRISAFRWFKELERDKRRTIGRLDYRFEGIDIDAAGERYEFDPSEASYAGAFVGAFMDYVRRELKFDSDLTYFISGNVRPWSFQPYENNYANVAETLRSAMTRNQNLRVMVCEGYYDVATPFYAIEYTVDHMSLDPSLKSHIGFEYYEAGHMMYIDVKAHNKLHKDIVNFIYSAMPR
jgi:carboxypeptidase C (cathepsin A)